MSWKDGIGLFLGVGLLCGAHAQAATRTFVHDGAPYRIELRENSPPLVIAITQSRDGFLWLGTLNGLVRFDGLESRVFDESTTPALQTSRIVYLFEDSQRRLWIGTETAGVVLAEAGRVTSLDIGKGYRESRLSAVCEDQLGGIWLYTVDGQLWRYADGQAKRFQPAVSENFFNTRRMLIADDAGKIWVGLSYKQFAFDPASATNSPNLPVLMEMNARMDGLLASRQGGYWRLATNHVQKWLGDRLQRDLGEYPWGLTRVSALAEDLRGNLIVGTRDAGLFWFGADGRATALSVQEGLSSPYILSIHVDAEGSIWVGTDGGGLNRIRSQAFDLLDETARWAVQSASVDASDGLWIGSIANGVAYHKGNELRRFTDGQLRGPLNDTRTVFVDREQRIWIGTQNGLFESHGPADKPRPVDPSHPAVRRAIFAIYQDRQGHLWFGTQDGLVQWTGQDWQVFTKEQGLGSDEVHAIAEDASGTLWIGTASGGLSQLKEGKITPFGRQEGLAGANISALFVDQKGTIWIGTSGRGLASFRDGQLRRFTTQEGLASNFITYLIEDEQGSLWVGSNRGVMRIQKSALRDFVPGSDRLIPVRVYGQADGLPTPECSSGSQPGVSRSTNGTIWCPTIQGLASINPTKLKPNLLPPPVVIESVLVDGQAQGTDALREPPLQSVTLLADKQRLDINYASLNLTAPERARFKYRLEKHEEDWIEAGNSRVARYGRLPPGKYRFRVIAANEDGIWNETGCGLDVIVEPPFYRTGWFVTIATLTLLGALVGMVYFFSTQKLQRQVQQFKQQEALERERARIARDIHDQVGASLTQVALLGELVESDKDSPQEIEAHAQQISRTARETTRALDEIVWTVNPSNDTLEGLVNYVCKYAQDYLAVAGVHYRLDVPAQLPNAIIPPDVRHNVFLAFKECITNVVRHAQATHVHLRLRLHPASFVLEIEDDGRGPGEMASPRAQTRNGLRNMRKRMEDIGGQFEIVPGAERGTIVRLTVPLA